jgi:hypothetical protein
MSSASCASAVMRLTPRDRVLVEVLQELRYLTPVQIQGLCYPSLSVQGTSKKLSRLRGHGLLECLGHRTFTDRRTFWGLTSLGRAVGRALRDDPPASGRASAVASLQMEHLIATNQIFCDLCRAHRAGRFGAFRWYASHHTQIGLGTTHLVPDAVILAAAPEGHWWMYCLELDRHTMPREALAEKFDRYRMLHRIAALRREDPLWEMRADCWVLFACGEARRARNAAALAAAVGLERLWAGDAAALPEALAAAVGVSQVLPQAAAPGLSGGIRPPAEPGVLESAGEGEGAP